MRNQNIYGNFRQSTPYSLEPQKLARVSIGKYVLEHRWRIEQIQTTLGSCVGLIGYMDGYGFMGHVFVPEQAAPMIRQLQADIQREVGRTLEEFQITLSWGGWINKTLGHIGRRNIEAVVAALERNPDNSIHLGKNSGNKVSLLLENGEIRNQDLSTQISS